MILAQAQCDCGIEEFENAVTHALADIFAGMIPLPLSLVGPVANRPSQFADSFSALIGFVGERRGLFGIHCSNELGQRFYRAMLGMDETGSDEDVRDLVGEVANMLAGGVKTLLLDNDLHIEIAVPQLFSGRCYQVHLPAKGDWHGWAFLADGADLLVELKLFE